MHSTFITWFVWNSIIIKDLHIDLFRICKFFKIATGIGILFFLAQMMLHWCMHCESVCCTGSKEGMLMSLYCDTEYTIFRLLASLLLRNWRSVFFFIYIYLWFRASQIYFIISNQQVAALSSILYYSLQEHCTCFGCSLHPSPGVHKTVDATTGTGRVSVCCRFKIC